MPTTQHKAKTEARLLCLAFSIYWTGNFSCMPLPTSPMAIGNRDILHQHLSCVNIGMNDLAFVRIPCKFSRGIRHVWPHLRRRWTLEPPRPTVCCRLEKRAKLFCDCECRNRNTAHHRTILFFVDLSSLHASILHPLFDQHISRRFFYS